MNVDIWKGFRQIVLFTVPTSGHMFANAAKDLAAMQMTLS